MYGWKLHAERKLLKCRSAKRYTQKCKRAAAKAELLYMKKVKRYLKSPTAEKGQRQTNLNIPNSIKGIKKGKYKRACPKQLEHLID